MRVKEITEQVTLERIIPYFQPIMDLRHDAVWRYECLARMVGNHALALLPDEFLYLLQRDNQVEQLTETMFTQSANYFRNYNIGWNINLDARDIQGDRFISFMTAILQDYPQPSRVALEVTATAAMQHPEQFRRFADTCQSVGLSVFIDRCDIPLSHALKLVDLPINGIKLAGAHVNRMAENKVSHDYVCGICELAEKQQLPVIAEHIEDKHNLQCIKEVGIHFAQGYFFSHPQSEVSAT